MDFFAESGKLSSTRLVFVGFAYIVIGGWAYVAVTTKALPDIPWNVVTILLGLGGVKVLQKGTEVKAQIAEAKIEAQPNG